MGKKYVDDHDQIYRVMQAASGDYKACRRGSWKFIAALPWQQTEEDAQADLDQMAAKKGWTKVTGGDE